MKTLGILGGMGPMATACFMERITAMTAADTDQEQIPVIVYSNTQIPDRSAYLLGRPQAENPVTALRQTAHFLDGACDYIAMPCVTAHAFYTQIQQELSHAVLFNMVELTVQSLKAQNIKKAGLLATDGTIAGGVFKESLKNAGIESVLPGALSQKSLMALIYRIKAGKEPDMAAFNRILQELVSGGAERIVLGCTEISILNLKEKCPCAVPYTDCMELLAEAAMAACGGQVAQKWRQMRKSIN